MEKVNKSLGVTESVFWKFKQFKLDKKFKTDADTLEYLLKHIGGKNK